MGRNLDFEPVRALRQLVRIYSVTDSPAEQQALAWSAEQFNRMGVDYKRVPKRGADGQIEEGQYAAIIAMVSGRGSGLKKLAVISDGHIDVVKKGKNWTKRAGMMEGTEMFGRGTTDMKSAVVAQILAARLARDSRDLPFDYYALVVAGEETTGWGTEQAVKYIQPEWKRYPNLVAIIPEPTSYIDEETGRKGTKVMYGNMGCFSAQIVIQGETGHAATARGKVNAIEVGMEVGIALKSLREKWQDTYKDASLGIPLLTPTLTEGGVAANSLPPGNTLRYDGRFPIELKGNYEKDLIKALEGFKGIDSKILYYANPAYTVPDHPWIKANLQSFGESMPGVPLWTTDGCFFTDADIPLVIAGPGYLNKLHVVDEKCDTSLIPLWAEKSIAAGRFYVASLKQAA